MSNARSASVGGAVSSVSVLTVTVLLSGPTWVPTVPTSAPDADWVAVSAHALTAFANVTL